MRLVYWLLSWFRRRPAATIRLDDSAHITPSQVDHPDEVICIIAVAVLNTGRPLGGYLDYDGKLILYPLDSE